MDKTTELFEQLSQNSLKAVVKSTKLLNSLPSGASRAAYCAYPSFSKIIDAQSDEILKIVSKVLKSQNIKGNIERRQQDEQFEMILDCNDVMLERINSSLDNLSGIRKTPETVLIESELKDESKEIRSGVWNSKSSEQKISTKNLITAHNIPRPQVNFTIPIDNSQDNAFEPKIKLKPNSLKPLAILPEYDDKGNIESFLHPYEFELLKFEPPLSQLEMTSPEEPPNINTTEFSFIDSKAELLNVLSLLKAEKQVAIDLEHHSYRSYQGFTCLMQISTKDKDFVIDTLKLRDELQLFNEVFTDPKILKIFHGADLDIEWLQRDLGLYIVNMFDTHQAAKMLSFSRLSLKFLLKRYCNIEADKKFQLADWRIRPLPEELIFYARQDTHYLIYIALMLHNELLNQPNGLSVLKAVYNKSTDICRKRYIKLKITEDSYMDMYKRSKRAFDNRQLYALKEIYLWRDKIARFEDESCGYVLPNHMLLQIAESLPREMQGILACCNPIPSLVRQNLNILHKIVLKAREQPLVKKHIQQEIVNRMVLPTKDFTSKLNSLYDISNEPEIKDELITPLTNNFESINFRFKPVLSVFEENDSRKKETENLKIDRSRNTKFVSPYERYKAVIPIVEKEKQEEISKIEQRKKNYLLCPFQTESTEDVILVRENKNVFSFPVNKDVKRKSDYNEDSENKKTKVSTKSERVAEIDEVEKLNLKKEKKKQLSTDTSVQNKPTVQSHNKVLQKDQEIKKENVKEEKCFDYSKVDFRNFQGGSYKQKKLDKRKGISKRSNKLNDKKYGKILTFSSGKKKK